MFAKPRILVAEPQDFSPRAAEILGEVADVTVGGVETEREFQVAFGVYDAIWVRLQRRIDSRVIPIAPRCRALACNTTGLDHIDLPLCERRGIEVISLRGETDFLRRVRATAEHTLGLTLALLRQLPAATADVHAGHWRRDHFRGHELFEKTVGIVGVGRLGSIVAEYFRALGMHVIGYDIRADFPQEVAERAESLGDLLERSDVTSLHVPLNDQTRGMIDGPALRQMRSNAVLINTARGGVIDEDALLQALQENWIAGAALDVLDGEPSITAAHPLVRWAAQNPRLLIVPHLGGNTYESLEKTECFIANRLAAALRRKEPHRCAS